MKDNQFYMIHGTDYKQMTIDLLEAADLASEIGNRDAKIGIKPNLVVAREASSGATTHPEIVEGVLIYLKDHGFSDLCVLEGSWVGDRTSSAFVVSGIGPAAKRQKVPYYDLQADSHTDIDIDGYSMSIVDKALELDWLINLPVLKGHCQTTVTCALKNHKGIITNAEKRRFHTQGLHRPIALLSKAVKDRMHEFIVVDNICGDLDFEEGGNPVRMDRIFCCKDPVLCDAFVAETMGYETDDIPYIGYAAQLGVGDPDISHAEFINVNEPPKGRGKFKPSRRVEKLASYTDAKDACSACYGNLIYALDRINDEGGLRNLKDKIRIGQGWQGIEGGYAGVGRCTKGCEHNCPGCPPTGAQMAAFIRSLGY